MDDFGVEELKGKLHLKAENIALAPEGVRMGGPRGGEKERTPTVTMAKFSKL